MNKEPRLRFTDEERANPALEKPIRKADKAAASSRKGVVGSSGTKMPTTPSTNAAQPSMARKIFTVQK